MCKTEKDCREAERRVRKLLGELKLELHPKKTRRVDLGWGRQGIDFLGCHLRKRFSGPVWEKKRKRKRVYFLQRWPSTKSMKRIRQRVKNETRGQYFRTGNAADKFSEIDKYVAQRLKRMRMHRKGRHLKPGEARQWNASYFQALGLHRLVGTVKIPGGCVMPHHVQQRPPVRRVREIRTHGLKGVLVETHHRVGES